MRAGNELRGWFNKLHEKMDKSFGEIKEIERKIEDLYKTIIKFMKLTNQGVVEK